jgi:hypothetical protein
MSAIAANMIRRFVRRRANGDGIANAPTQPESEFRIYAPTNVRRMFAGQGRR